MQAGEPILLRLTCNPGRRLFAHSHLMGNASCVDRLAECPGSRRETPPFLAPSRGSITFRDFDMSESYSKNAL